jgi:hypothetical protein
MDQLEDEVEMAHGMQVSFVEVHCLIHLLAHADDEDDEGDGAGEDEA